MLEVLRFWCTKDLKFVKSRPCKAYNSTLGEFFRCNWEVDEAAQPIPLMRQEADEKTELPLATREPTKKTDEKVRLSFLTEQTSHHPPVSAFYVDCPAKGISARGFDQMSAKFTGTSVKVLPGEHNYGIFITIHKRDNEEYQCTHPVGNLGGFLRGGLTLGINEMAYITCPQTKLKTMIHYVEEGWIGRTQNKIDGVIYKYDPENDDKTRVRDVPAQDILVKISGNWKDKVYISFAPDFKVCLSYFS